MFGIITPRNVRYGILVFSMLLVLQGVAFAQEPAIYCEERLGQLQGRLDLVAITREQGEQVAGTAIGQLRLRNAELEKQVKTLQADLEKLKTSPAEQHK